MAIATNRHRSRHDSAVQCKPASVDCDEACIGQLAQEGEEVLFKDVGGDVVFAGEDVEGMLDVGVLFEQTPDMHADGVESEIKFAGKIQENGFIAGLLQPYLPGGPGAAC
ncbi:MAG TPA: hypothetical protein VKM00_03960 [Luteimonas sp.]|nr:hypothetical protein [Luteimonas sp.]